MSIINTGSIEKKEENNSGWIVFVTILMTLIPSTSLGNIISAITVTILCVFNMPKSKIYVPLSIAKICALIFASVIVAIFSVLVFEKRIDIQIVSHELIRLVYDVALIVILCNTEYDRKLAYIACLIVFAIVFTIQIIQFISPESINILIKKYYSDIGDDAHHLLLSYEKSYYFRAGSIYINPNICGQTMVIILIVVLDTFIELGGYHNIILTLLIGVSVLLTGSRTAFILFAFEIMALTYFGKNRINKSYIRVFYLFIIFGAYYIFFVSGFEIRSVDMQNGMEASILVKVQNMLTYCKNTNPILLITGALGTYSNIEVDAELFYILVYYGVFGMTWYFMLIKYIGNLKPYNGIRSSLSVCTILLCSFSSSIILCFPIVSLFLAIALTKGKKEYR